MAESPATRIWLGRAVFLGLALFIMFCQLIPLNAEPSVWAPPELLVGITLAWVARRPDHAPVTLIALVFLLADLLFQRPPGLWTALVVLLTEAMRARSAEFRNMPLMLEWGTVAMGLAAITLANRVVLAVVMTAQAPLAMTVVQMLMTILIYPVIVLLAHAVFGVSRPAPGAVDSLGHRI